MQVEEFEEFARARTAALRRSAWLLCGDAHQADDLVQETLAKLYVRWTARTSSWPGRRTVDNPVAYSHTVLTRTFLSSRRPMRSTERPAADLPERAVPDPTGVVDVRMALLDLLAGLAPADRAVLVLRYLDDLPVEEVARLTGSSSGAVRTRASRALARLRPLLDDSLAVTPEKGTTHE